MNLKDLREKFHDYDAKISSAFHKDENRMKNPSWGKIIFSWLSLVIILAVVSSLAITPLTTEGDVYQEITPVFSDYRLEYGSYKSSTYYIYSKSGNYPNKEVYHISYDGKLKVSVNTSNISNNDYFVKVMDSYINGNNEYNASVDVKFTAYDSKDKKIDTFYSLGLDDGNLNIRHGIIDLLLFNKPKIEYKDGFLTVTVTGNDKRLSDSSLSSSLDNIDHIDGTIHVFNKDAGKTSDHDFYNYTLHFTIPKSSINVKNS